MIERFRRWANEPVCPRYYGWLVALSVVAALLNLVAWAIGA